MTEPDNTPAVPLPQTVLGRRVLAVICVLLFPLAAFICFGLFFTAPTPGDVLELMFRIVVEVLATAMLLFSFVGLVWATARPAWAEVVIQQAIRKLMWAVLLFCLFSLPVVFWALWANAPQGR